MASDLLLAHVDVPPDQVHAVPYGGDPREAAAQYGRTLAETLAGDGLDLVLLGMGADGHTASLFPGSEALYVDERGATACFVSQVDGWRVSLTMREINHGAQALVLVAGAEKAAALADVRSGHSQSPAARVAPSGRSATWLTDRETAAAVMRLLRAPGAEPDRSADAAKRHAAEAAARAIEDGWLVGLGTGSTARLFVEALACRLRSGDLHGVTGVPTSAATARQAESLGIPLTGEGALAHPQVTVDGADEVSPDLDLLKGMGGALVREKIVASASRRMWVIADDQKLVDRLGERSPVPIAVVPFGWRTHLAAVESLGGAADLRQSPSGESFVTDDGLWILDARFATGIDDPAALDAALAAIAGVAACGVFAGMAERAFVGDREGAWLYRRLID
jgi:ribose 5-phosphate isomerase A